MNTYLEFQKNLFILLLLLTLNPNSVPDEIVTKSRRIESWSMRALSLFFFFFLVCKEKLCGTS